MGSGHSGAVARCLHSACPSSDGSLTDSNDQRFAALHAEGRELIVAAKHGEARYRLHSNRGVHVIDKPDDLESSSLAHDVSHHAGMPAAR